MIVNRVTIVVLYLDKNEKEGKEAQIFGVYSIPDSLSYKEIQDFIYELKKESGLSLEWYWMPQIKIVDVNSKKVNVYSVRSE